MAPPLGARTRSRARPPQKDPPDHKTVRPQGSRQLWGGRRRGGARRLCPPRTAPAPARLGPEEGGPRCSRVPRVPSPALAPAPAVGALPLTLA